MLQGVRQPCVSAPSLAIKKLNDYKRSFLYFAEISTLLNSLLVSIATP